MPEIEGSVLLTGAVVEAPEPFRVCAFEVVPLVVVVAAEVVVVVAAVLSVVVSAMVGVVEVVSTLVVQPG